MAFASDDQKDIFALDKWLRNLGLWRGKPVDAMDAAERAQELARFFDGRGTVDHPLVMTGEGYDENSRLLAMVTSETSYDAESGVFEDKIIFWDHKPYSSQGADDEAQREEGEHTVIMIRGRQDPSAKSQGEADTEIPQIIPDLITVGGTPIFTGPIKGGRDNPFEDKHRVMIDRVMSFSKRVKEALYNRVSVLDMGKVLAGGRQHEDVFAKAFGAAAHLPSLSKKGGVQAALAAYFIEQFEEEGQAQRFTFRQRMDAAGKAVGLDPVSQLKAFMGHHVNTADPWRAAQDIAEETDTEMSSGVRFACRMSYEPDIEFGRGRGMKRRPIHRFKMTLMPVDVPDSIEAPAPIDLVQLSFTQEDEQNFTLAHANFFEGDEALMRRWGKARGLIGLYQDMARDIAERRYPKIRDYIFKNRRHDDLPEMAPPPGEEEGGEMVIIPLHGTGLEKTIETAGNGIGGGIAMMSRVTKNKGNTQKERISEVLIASDLPWEPGGANSVVDGYQPDLTQWLTALRQGALVLSHDHFDHATLEYYGKNGWLRGVPVVCNARVKDMVETRMKKLQVSPENWPQFVTYDHPAMRQIGTDHYAYPVKDEDGVTRGWVQICENGVKHSALTDSHIFTMCYGDDHYKDSIYIPNDNFGLTERGKKFAKHGQLALARLPEVTLSKLREKIKTPSEKFIAYMECTNVTTSGSAADQEEKFRNNFRKMMSLFKDEAVLWFSFSTNHLERQAVYEVWGEADTLRHSTSLGANSQIRDTSLNKHGVNPDIDLRGVEFAANDLPQSFYDTALTALEDYVQKRVDLAAERAAKPKVRKTQEDILEKDLLYRVTADILARAQEEIKSGNSKPDIIFRRFLNADEEAFDKHAAAMGLPAGDEPRSMPKIVEKALKDYKKELKESLSGAGYNPDSATEYWMLRMLLKHGKVRFETIGNIPETNMHQAIKAGQKFAALHGSHTAEYVKAFRETPGMLGIAGTGATGSLEEYFAILSRYARSESPMEDKDDAVNGYYLNEKDVPRALFVTQPPSMGEEAALTQEKLIREIVVRRNDTVVLSFREGFKVYNPKGRRHEFEAFFKEQGWHVNDASANMITVGNALMHISGHGLWQDVYDMVKFLPAKTFEAMHIPSWRAFHDFREIVQRLGKNTSIERPANYVACVPEIDTETGKTVIRQRDWMPERRWGFILDRTFGKQWGGTLRTVLYTLLRRDGNKATDGMDIRTDMDGPYEQQLATGLAGDFARASDPHSSRAALAGPAPSELRASTTQKRGRSAFSLSRFKRSHNNDNENGGGNGGAANSGGAQSKAKKNNGPKPAAGGGA